MRDTRNKKDSYEYWCLALVLMVVAGLSSAAGSCKGQLSQYDSQVKRWSAHAERKCHPYQLDKYNFESYSWKCAESK